MLLHLEIIWIEIRTTQMLSRYIGDLIENMFKTFSLQSIIGKMYACSACV